MTSGASSSDVTSQGWRRLPAYDDISVRHFPDESPLRPAPLRLDSKAMSIELGWHSSDSGRSAVEGKPSPGRTAVDPGRMRPEAPSSGNPRRRPSPLRFPRPSIAALVSSFEMRSRRRDGEVERCAQTSYHSPRRESKINRYRPEDNRQEEDCWLLGPTEDTASPQVLGEDPFHDHEQGLENGASERMASSAQKRDIEEKTGMTVAERRKIFEKRCGSLPDTTGRTTQGNSSLHGTPLTRMLPTSKVGQAMSRARAMAKGLSNSSPSLRGSYSKAGYLPLSEEISGVTESRYRGDYSMKPSIASLRESHKESSQSDKPQDRAGPGTQSQETYPSSRETGDTVTPSLTSNHQNTRPARSANVCSGGGGDKQGGVLPSTPRRLEKGLRDVPHLASRTSQITPKVTLPTSKRSALPLTRNPGELEADPPRDDYKSPVGGTGTEIFPQNSNDLQPTPKHSAQESSPWRHHTPVHPLLRPGSVLKAKDVVEVATITSDTDKSLQGLRRSDESFLGLPVHRGGKVSDLRRLFDRPASASRSLLYLRFRRQQTAPSTRTPIPESTSNDSATEPAMTRGVEAGDGSPPDDSDLERQHKKPRQKLRKCQTGGSTSGNGNLSRQSPVKAQIGHFESLSSSSDNSNTAATAPNEEEGKPVNPTRFSAWRSKNRGHLWGRLSGSFGKDKGRTTASNVPACNDERHPRGSDEGLSERKTRRLRAKLVKRNRKATAHVAAIGQEQEPGRDAAAMQSEDEVGETGGGSVAPEPPTATEGTEELNPISIEITSTFGEREDGFASRSNIQGQGQGQVPSSHLETFADMPVSEPLHRRQHEEDFNVDGSNRTTDAGVYVHQHNPAHLLDSQEENGPPPYTPPNTAVPSVTAEAAVAAAPESHPALDQPQSQPRRDRSRNPFRSDQTSTIATASNSTEDDAMIPSRDTVPNLVAPVTAEQSSTSDDNNNNLNHQRKLSRNWMAAATSRLRAQTMPEGSGGDPVAAAATGVRVAHPKCTLQHPRPVRGRELRRLVSLCKDRGFLVGSAGGGGGGSGSGGGGSGLAALGGRFGGRM